jgi:hypothetical protein
MTTKPIPEWAYKAAEEIMHAEPVPYPEQAEEGVEIWAEIIARHAMIDRVVERGDAILRWMVTIAVTACSLALLMACAGQYLSGR